MLSGETTTSASSASQSLRDKWLRCSGMTRLGNMQTGESWQEASPAPPQALLIGLTLTTFFSMGAYSNILSQCYSGASVNPTDSPNANWSLGDEWYWVTFNNSVPSIGQNSEDGDVLVQPDGVPIYG